MARRGQVGTVVKKGNWYRVRFWKYPVGQDRVYVSEKICPVEPTAIGYLSKGERRRRANEIVEQSGVNDKQQFVETNTQTTFRQQAEWFMKDAAERCEDKTLTGWQSAIDVWLNPNIGDLPLASVTNSTLKTLVQTMVESGKLGRVAIKTYIKTARMVVKSAQDAEGNFLFPRVWNHKFIMKPLENSNLDDNKSQQEFISEEVNSILAKAETTQLTVLYSLLAGSGLRIGEALQLQVKHLSDDCRTIDLTNDTNLRLKTRNAKRKIDLCPSLAVLVKAYIGDRKNGLVFASRKGRPLHQSNLLRRSLHPILKLLNVPQTGFHAFRRFRITYLEGPASAPAKLVKYWVGHEADKSVTGLYTKFGRQNEWRLAEAEKVGVGFTVPAPSSSMAPLTPRKAVETEAGKAA